VIHTLIIDGNSLFKIGFHGVKNFYNDEQHVGAIFHFISTIKKWLVDGGYNKVVVFWDGPRNKIKRREIYPPYKEGRKRDKMREDSESFRYQQNRIKQYLEELFVRQGIYEYAEADDCIAYYCQNSPKEKKTIYTVDKDLTQLISKDVKVYLASTKTELTHEDKIPLRHIAIPPSNMPLVKILVGDSSDNFGGIEKLGEKSLLKMFPKVVEEDINFDYIFDISKEIINESPKNVIANNILKGKSREGEFGSEFYSMGTKLIDLKNPILKEESKKDIDELINSPLDPTDRHWKNIMKLMMEDGLFRFLPKKDDGWSEYLQPFIKLGRIEKKKYKKQK
tara:strand:- start:14 stop:1021 length:1008 start_codon:yes stop_codon:yes gene_type:complete